MQDARIAVCRKTTVACSFSGLDPILALDQPGDNGPRFLENEAISSTNKEAGWTYA